MRHLRLSLRADGRLQHGQHLERTGGRPQLKGAHPPGRPRLAGYAHRALALGVLDDEVNRFFAEALATIGEELSPEYLQPTLLKTGEMCCKCKVLLGQGQR